MINKIYPTIMLACLFNTGLALADVYKCPLTIECTSSTNCNVPAPWRLESTPVAVGTYNIFKWAEVYPFGDATCNVATVASNGDIRQIELHSTTPLYPSSTTDPWEKSGNSYPEYYSCSNLSGGSDDTCTFSTNTSYRNAAKK